MNQLDQIAIELDGLYKEVSSRRWVQYTTGFNLGMSEAETNVKNYLKDPEKYKLILNAIENEVDPLKQRKANILNNQMKEFHLSERVRKIQDEIDEVKTSLMDIINKFRAKIDGKEISTTELGKILGQSPDRKLRQKAYESNLPLNQLLVDNGFLKLLDLRKELALACGHNNFVDYVLDHSELKSDIFKNWFSLCNERVDRYQAKTRHLAQQYLYVENLMPWDQRYLQNQISPLNNTQVDLTNFFDLMSKTFLRLEMVLLTRSNTRFFNESGMSSSKDFTGLP